MAYNPAIADEIASRIATGETLRAICREDGMPCWRTVYDWINSNPEFAARIAQARETGYDAIAEEAMAIADEPPPSTQFGTTDGGAVQHAKLRIETRLKLLAKWSPKKYGDKQQIEHSGQIDVAQAILAARKRGG
jgi:hypothetical protein